jgi:hypothetical protein
MKKRRQERYLKLEHPHGLKTGHFDGRLEGKTDGRNAIQCPVPGAISYKLILKHSYPIARNIAAAVHHSMARIVKPHLTSQPWEDGDN